MDKHAEFDMCDVDARNEDLIAFTEKHDIEYFLFEVAITGGDYTPRQPDVGIMEGYYENCECDIELKKAYSEYFDVKLSQKQKIKFENLIAKEMQEHEQEWLQELANGD